MTVDNLDDNHFPDRGLRPAERLAGMDLPNGWKVESAHFPEKNSTGGQFSVQYIVSSESGDKAFLKAMDFESSLASVSPTDKLYETIQNFRHERQLNQICESMTRVVRLLDSGETHVDPADPYSAVFYLIFELADSDIRAHVSRQDQDDVGHLLQLMHQVSVASQQLHSAKISHLDIKPSNVLVFRQLGARLADLGRSIVSGQSSPVGSFACMGDMRYAPLELLYANVRPEWKDNRESCDFYLLGNLLFFLLTSSSLTQMLSNRLVKLDSSLHYGNRAMSYDHVFPYVSRTFFQIIRELRSDPRVDYVPEIVDVVRQFCDPDPSQRGLPLNRGASRYSLQRLISRLDLLHKRNRFSHLHSTRSGKELLS
ncbi:MAG: hypothetical protein OXJ55_03295 [Caldilineaceae bacterium]|nr:hypothetical protein [Caldilineaceae bacterium]